VAKMLNDVEWKETPVFKQHFNIKVTEAESLQGTQIGIRRYKELAKNKGKSMAQVALDLKDEKLRR
jgi:aryl-alcohol dehydrogenase-like predicted oxidoreductase